jgi:hypothetical protein
VNARHVAVCVCCVCESVCVLCVCECVCVCARVRMFACVCVLARVHVRMCVGVCVCFEMSERMTVVWRVNCALLSHVPPGSGE